MSTEKEIAKVKVSNDTKVPLRPKGMKLHEFGYAAHIHVQEMSQEHVRGPRVFDEVLVIDGARAFANACKKVLGEDITTAIPGYTPQVLSIESQDLVYEWQGKKFTEAMLNDVSVFSEDALDKVAQAFMAAVPRNINAERAEIAKAISAEAEIVSVSPSETSAVMGVVRLRQDGEVFGEAHLSEDEETGNFTLMIKTILENKEVVDQLIAETEQQIRGNSLYRGRAYDYCNKRFINDLDFDTSQRIVLATRLTKRIRSKVANKINGKSQRGLTTNRFYLASGEPGTGKTETARALGAYAIKHRLTFLTFMPKTVDMEELKRFLEFANKIGPSFVVIEDVEKMIGADKAAYSQMLEVIDGVSSKSRKMHVWFTTNHASVDDNQFTEKFLRRMNAIINFDVRNEATYEGMFAVYMPSDWDIAQELTHKNDMLVANGRISDDEFVVHPKMERLVKFVKEANFKPWAVKATIDNAIDYIDDGGTLSIEDQLLDSADEILEQIHLAETAPKEKEEDGLEARHRTLYAEATK